MADPRDRDRPPLPASSRVAVWTVAGHTRSKLICEALCHGLRKNGIQPELHDQAMWPQYVRNQIELPPVAAFYGLEGHLPEIFRHYRDHRRAAVYVDLGYWGRREGGRFTGYHKVVVNARHPTGYFRNVQSIRLMGRFDRFDIIPKPMRNSRGGLILLAGMGDKGAIAEGMDPEWWERMAVGEIKMHHTGRPILYRPKPSWKDAKPIPGTTYCPRTVEIPWAQLSAVVTHHSNVAVDGLIEGLPTYCVSGVASPMVTPNLSAVLLGVDYAVPSVEERLAWCEDIAYTQWSVAEIAAGACWKYLQAEELI